MKVFFKLVNEKEELIKWANFYRDLYFYTETIIFAEKCEKILCEIEETNTTES